MEGDDQSGAIHHNQHHFGQDFDLHLVGNEKYASNYMNW